MREQGLAIRDAGRHLRLLLIPLIILSLFLFLPATGRCSDETPVLNVAGTGNIAPSVDPIRDRDGFSAILYNNRNGLPTSDANAITQTSEGFLWIGSYAGLIRYDGSTFERVSSGDGIANVRCLFVDSEDRLWIGTNDAGLFLMSKSLLMHWTKADGLRSNSVRAVTEDDDGCIYVSCASGGIAIVDEDLKLSAFSDERIDNRTVAQLHRGNDGLIYGFTLEGDLFTVRDSGIISFLPHDGNPVEGILSILPDPEHAGGLYIGTADTKICYGTLKETFDLLAMYDVSPLSYVHGMESIDGKIWICADNGIGRLDSGVFRLLENVPLNNSAEHILTDYEGNLWFTSPHQGVMKIVSNPFPDIFARYDLPETVVNSTCCYGEQLFIGTDTGLIVLDGDARAERVPITSIRTASGKKLKADDLLAFLEGARIRCISTDSRGRLWIPVWRKYGLVRYDHGEVVVFTEEDGLFSDSVRNVTEREDGTILAAGNGGVCAIRGDRVTARYGAKEGLLNETILTVEEGYQQELLFGSDGDGIYIIGPDGLQHIGLEEGLSSEIILRIKKSRSREFYWIITGNSLAIMTPDHRVTTIREFPYPNNYDLYENSNGDAWVLSSAGIYVVPVAELLANGPIEATFYGIQSGIACAPSPNAVCELTDAGDLYVAGTSGVFRVNIEKPIVNAVDLRLSIPFIDADGERYYADENGEFYLPANARKVTIYPYVFNYALIDPIVTYELEGFDWPAATVSRAALKPIDYTNLKLGNYRFVMTVRDAAERTEQTVSFPIIKGRELSFSTIGSVILDYSTLLLLIGILILTSLYRKRGRIEDRLFFGLIVTDIALTVGELLSYQLEYIEIPGVRPLMILANTVYYTAMTVFIFLLSLYLAYCSNDDREHLRRNILLYGIPCALFIIVVIINIRTGWIFSIGQGSIFRPGPQRLVPFWGLPMLFYLLHAVWKAFKIDRHLCFSFVVLIAARAALALWVRAISSTSFIYALTLVIIHLYAMSLPMREEAT